MAVKKSQPVAADGAAILDLLESWLLKVRAENKSPATVDSYGLGVRRYAAWADARGLRTGVGAVTAETVLTFMDDLLHHTKPLLTAKSVHVYVSAFRLFLGWCVDEGEIAAHPMARVKLPKLIEQPPVILADVDLAALLRACEGRDYLAKRDAAILRLMVATPLRRGGFVGMKLADLDLARRLVRVRNKGGEEYWCPFDADAASALDRYRRERARHRLAASEMLWLGARGPLSGSGLYRMLRRRAAQAGLGHLGIHPHLTRGTWAVRARRAKMSAEAIKRIARWKNSRQYEHYIGAMADELAVEEYEDAFGKRGPRIR